MRISGDLTIYSVLDWKDKIQMHINGAQGDVELDLGDVSDFDGAGLQLLIHAVQDAASRGLALTVSNPSPVVTEVLELVRFKTWSAAKCQSERLVAPEGESR